MVPYGLLASSNEERAGPGHLAPPGIRSLALPVTSSRTALLAEIHRLSWRGGTGCHGALRPPRIEQRGASRAWSPRATWHPVACAPGYQLQDRATSRDPPSVLARRHWMPWCLTASSHRATRSEQGLVTSRHLASGRLRSRLPAPGPRY